MASVLKPVDDVRMYRKFGRSLAKNYQIHIFGYKAAENANIRENNIYYHPLYDFHRLHFKRFLVSFLFIRKIHQIRPNLIIVHCVELLFVAIICKYIYRSTLIYDIRENYYQNIIYQNIYPSFLKPFIAISIRLLEYISRFFVSYYFLAEKIYAKELPFIRNKYITIENKAQLNFSKKKFLFQKEKLKLLYYGTISTVYGAKESIVLTEKLREKGIATQLTFVGIFAEKKLESFIQNKNLQTSYINIIGGKLVAYERILEALRQTDIAVLPYLPNKSTQNCIPTKLYECLAIGCPMIIQKNVLWQKICDREQTAIWIDFQRIDIDFLIEKLQNANFYPKGIFQNALWRSEESKLLKAVDSILL